MHFIIVQIKRKVTEYEVNEGLTHISFWSTNQCNKIFNVNLICYRSFYNISFKSC